MATPFPFQSGQTLLASQLNAITTLPSTTKTASHTLVIADQGTRVIMNSASATSVTVDDSVFGAGDIVEIQNIGAGVATVVAGTATVSSAGPLAIPQNGGGRLVFSSASAATYFPTAVTASPGGLELVSTTTIGSAVATVTVTGAFSATYDNYKIIVSGGAASADVGLHLRLGTTATGYFSVYIFSSYNLTTVAGFNTNNGDLWESVGATTADGHRLCIDVLNPFLAKKTSFNGALQNQTINAGVNSGYVDNTVSYTSFRISTSSGTVTGGQVRVYGYKN